MRYESGWTIQGEQLLWKSNDATVTYYAYLPYTGTVGDAASYAFTVQIDQSNEYNVKASDLLWTGGRQDATAGKALDINFKHALSKLNVTLTKGSELEDGVTFTSVRLSNCATATTVNLTDGTTGTATNSQTITLYAATANEKYECILVPQTFGGNHRQQRKGIYIHIQQRPYVCQRQTVHAESYRRARQSDDGHHFCQVMG